MRRQLLAAVFSMIVGPARPNPLAPSQQVATVKDIPPVLSVNAEDRMVLSQGLFSGSVTVGRLFATAPVAATNSTVARRLGDRFADTINAKDYGATLDGKTDDSQAIRSAQAVAGLNAVSLPIGTASIKALPDTMSGRFNGEGRLRTGDGLPRGRMFARRSTEPTRYSNMGDISTAFDGDFSTVHLAIEHRIDGDSTLTRPSSNYAFHHENSAITVFCQNKSGYNALSNDQGGRTGCAAITGRIVQEGQGDAAILSLGGTVYGTNPGSTHFLANPAVLLMFGDVFGFADGTYQQVDEFSHNDYGFDVAVSSTVRNFYRTNDAGAKGAWWVATRYQSSGTKAVDVAFQILGRWKNVLDTSNMSTGPTKAVATLAAGQRIYLNASNPDFYSNPAAVRVGDVWLTYNPGSGKVEIVVKGAPVIQASAQGIEGNVLTPITNIYKESGPISVSDLVAVIEADQNRHMSIGIGKNDGHTIVIKCIGNGKVYLTGILDNTKDNILELNSQSSMEVLSLLWSSNYNSWLVLSRSLSNLRSATA